MSGRAGTVLLVDADPATARTVRDALSSGRVRVLAAADPYRALSLLEGEGVDVLLSELLLPEGSGLRLLVKARLFHPAVVRVALTAVEDFPAAVAAINEAEVFRFLRKPVEAAVLRETVEEALVRAEAAHEVRDARAAAERRRVALVDLESHHAGISLVQLSPDGYFLPPQRLAGLTTRLRGMPVGRALADAIAAFRGAKGG